MVKTIAKNLGISLGTLSTILSIVALVGGGIISTVAWVRANDLDTVQEKVGEAVKARAAALQLEETARKARDEQLTDRITSEEAARKVADGNIEASILAQEKRTSEVLQGIREVETRLARRLELMEERLSKRIDTLEGRLE